MYKTYKAVLPMLKRWCAGVGLSVMACAAFAQDFPTRAIELVVPYPPGASVDLLARLIQPTMSEVLGQQVVVENRGGAGGNIGSASVARSTPDGYRILLATNAGLTINPHVYKDIGYDVMNDLAPVTLLARGPIAIGVRSDLGIETVKQLVEYAKQNPGKLNYGTPGSGSPQHLIGELLADRAGINITHVPYRGIGPAVTDLFGGSIEMVISTLAGFSSYMDSGKIKIIAISDAERFPDAPDNPTIAETFPGFEASAWFAVMTAAGTPPDRIAKLDNAIRAALDTPKVQEAFKNVALIAVKGGPEEARALIKSDYDRWGAVVREKGIAAN